MSCFALLWQMAHTSICSGIPYTTADAQENIARTANGQLIPENAQQLDGRWSGEADNLGGFVEHAARLGASIEYAGEGNWINSISCTPKVCIVERKMRWRLILPPAARFSSSKHLRRFIPAQAWFREAD